MRRQWPPTAHRARIVAQENRRHNDDDGTTVAMTAMVCHGRWDPASSSTSTFGSFYQDLAGSSWRVGQATRSVGGCRQRASKGRFGSDIGFFPPSIPILELYMCFSSLYVVLDEKNETNMLSKFF